MNTKEFSEAMNEIDSRYIEEAVNYKQKAKNPVWVKWGAMAACVCVMIVGGVILTQNNRQTVPDPELVQLRLQLLMRWKNILILRFQFLTRKWMRIRLSLWTVILPSGR